MSEIVDELRRLATDYLPSLSPAKHIVERAAAHIERLESAPLREREALAKEEAYLLALVEPKIEDEIGKTFHRLRAALARAPAEKEG